MDLEGEIDNSPQKPTEVKEISIAKTTSELMDAMFHARQQGIFEVEVSREVIGALLMDKYNPNVHYMHYKDFTLYEAGWMEKIKSKNSLTINEIESIRSEDAKEKLAKEQAVKAKQREAYAEAQGSESN